MNKLFKYILLFILIIPFFVVRDVDAITDEDLYYEIEVPKLLIYSPYYDENYKLYFTYRDMLAIKLSNANQIFYLNYRLRFILKMGLIICFNIKLIIINITYFKN